MAVQVPSSSAMPCHNSLPLCPSSLGCCSDLCNLGIGCGGISHAVIREIPCLRRVSLHYRPSACGMKRQRAPLHQEGTRCPGPLRSRGTVHGVFAFWQLRSPQDRVSFLTAMLTAPWKATFLFPFFKLWGNNYTSMGDGASGGVELVLARSASEPHVLPPHPPPGWASAPLLCLPAGYPVPLEELK